MPPSAAKDQFIREVLAAGLYEVMPDGSIISKVRKKHRVLKQSLMDDGYCRVGLSRDGEVHYVKAHRVVAIALVSNPDGKPEVNHKNGKKADNHPLNLEWVTDLENVQHAITTGLLVPLTGEDVPAAKLTEEQVGEIRILLSGTHLTQSQIGSLYGVGQSTISMIKIGANW